MLKSFLVLSSAALIALGPAVIAAAAPQTTAAPAGPTPGATNPVKATPESIAHAKKLYTVDCEICHAAKGDGKSQLAKDLNLSLQDWSDPKTLAGKTDGELFQAIRKGNEKMPPEAVSRAKDEDVWNLVHYIRSFSKEHTAVAKAAE